MALVRFRETAQGLDGLEVVTVRLQSPGDSEQSTLQAFVIRLQLREHLLDAMHVRRHARLEKPQLRAEKDDSDIGDLVPGQVRTVLNDAVVSRRGFHGFSPSVGSGSVDVAGGHSRSMIRRIDLARRQIQSHHSLRAEALTCHSLGTR